MAGLIAATIDLQSRWTSVPFRVFVAILALTVALFMWRSQPMNRWCLLMSVWLALYSIRLSSNVVSGYPTAMHEIIFFCLAVVLPVFAFFKCNLREIEPKVIVLLIWLSSIILIFSIAGAYLGWFGKNISIHHDGRLSTSTLNPITLGHVATSLLLASVAWNERINYRGSLIAVALISLGLIALSYSGSRGPFFALILPLAVFLFAKPWAGLAPLVHRAMIVIIIGLAIWLMWNPLPMDHLIAKSATQHGFGNDYIENQLVNVERTHQDRLIISDKSSSARIGLLTSSLTVFLENPIFGISNWIANKGQYPHNLALEAFQNLGVVGGGMFLLLLVVGTFQAWRRIRQGEYMIALLFFQALVAGQFSGSLHATAQLWTTLALLLSSNLTTKKYNI